MTPLCSVSGQLQPTNSGDNVFTVQVHEVTAKLEQQVSSLTAALEGSKQREGLTAHKLSQCEEQLQTVSKLLKLQYRTACANSMNFRQSSSRSTC